MADNRPIGIFDSGIGGLPIARQVRELLPHEDILYVADTYHAPYGEKSEDEILKRSLSITDMLIEQNVKAIVVACNTATMVSIKTLRQRHALPFIGVEPGVRPAALNTQTGVIGVLATSKTLSSHAFVDLAHRVASHVQVEIQPCPELVKLIESLQLDFHESVSVVENYVRPLLEKGADTLILGCTHFVHLAPVIQAVSGPDVLVISTEQAVAREVKRRIESEQLLSDHSRHGRNQFLSNGEQHLFSQQVHRLWGNDAELGPFSS